MRTDTIVVACGLSRAQQVHVADGLRRADCTYVATFEQLEQMLPAMPRCDAVVLAPRDHQQRDAVDVVRCLARQWPGTAIVVFCPPRGDDAVSFRALALAGVHQFVFEGMHNTAASVARAVEYACRASSAEVVLRGGDEARLVAVEQVHAQRLRLDAGQLQAHEVAAVERIDVPVAAEARRVHHFVHALGALAQDLALLLALGVHRRRGERALDQRLRELRAVRDRAADRAAATPRY